MTLSSREMDPSKNRVVKSLSSLSVVRPVSNEERVTDKSLIDVVVTLTYVLVVIVKRNLRIDRSPLVDTKGDENSISVLRYCRLLPDVPTGWSKRWTYKGEWGERSITPCETERMKGQWRMVFRKRAR